jgi:DNA-binding NtrC family response regulator
VLVVDSNRELLQFLERMMSDAGWDVLIAGTAFEARRLAAKRKPHAVLVDSALPDDRGVSLAAQLCRANPELRGIVMTGAALPVDENEARTRSDITLLEKPFLLRDALNLIRSRLLDPSRELNDDSPKAA